jgi:hypothetical protein
VLRGLKVAVPALSFEANLPLFRAETIECIELLAFLDADYRFAMTIDMSSGWREPHLTADEAKVWVAQADGYCEVFAVRLGRRPEIPN